jgi:hypothetical protein
VNVEPRLFFAVTRVELARDTIDARHRNLIRNLIVYQSLRSKSIGRRLDSPILTLQ